MSDHPSAATRLLAALCLAAALGGAGCTGYQLGTTLPPNLRTLAVTPFVNESGEPQIEGSVTRAILQEVQREGQLRIVSPESADILLTGTVVSYRLEPMRYDRDRPTAVREYRAVIRASIHAVDRAKNTTLADVVVDGDATFLGTGDLVTAKRSAMPAAARDLAHEIVNAIVSAW